MPVALALAPSGKRLFVAEAESRTHAAPVTPALRPGTAETALSPQLEHSRLHLPDRALKSSILDDDR
jgi:hypothetical protein